METIILQKQPSGFKEKAIAYRGGMKLCWWGHNQTCPDYRHKYVIINCNRYRINWIKA